MSAALAASALALVLYSSSYKKPKGIPREIEEHVDARALSHLTVRDVRALNIWSAQPKHMVDDHVIVCVVPDPGSLPVLPLVAYLLNKRIFALIRKEEPTMPEHVAQDDRIVVCQIEGETTLDKAKAFASKFAAVTP